MTVAKEHVETRLSAIIMPHAAFGIRLRRIVPIAVPMPVALNDFGTCAGGHVRGFDRFALGRGWGSQVCWLDIEVARAPSGKPDILLHDKTARRADGLGIRRWALSITHTEAHGMAFVIALDE